MIMRNILKLELKIILILKYLETLKVYIIYQMANIQKFKLDTKIERQQNVIHMNFSIDLYQIRI